MKLIRTQAFKATQYFSSYVQGPSHHCGKGYGRNIFTTIIVIFDFVLISSVSASATSVFFTLVLLLEAQAYLSAYFWKRLIFVIYPTMKPGLLGQRVKPNKQPSVWKWLLGVSTSWDACQLCSSMLGLLRPLSHCCWYFSSAQPLVLQAECLWQCEAELQSAPLWVVLHSLPPSVGSQQRS